MEQIYDNCCGVDVHKKLIVACFKHGRKQEVREFGATTRELLDLAGWLTVKHIDELAAHIKELDDDIYRHMKDDEKVAAAQIQEITGIGNTSAEVVISVIGTDMSRFPTDAHLASWAGLCPGNNQRKPGGEQEACRTLL